MVRTHVPSTGSSPPGYRLRSGRRRPALRRRGEARGLCGEADGHSLVDRGDPLRGRPAAGHLGTSAAQPLAQHDTRAGSAVGLALVVATGPSPLLGRLNETIGDPLDQASVFWQEPKAYACTDKYESDGGVHAPPRRRPDVLGGVEVVATPVDVFDGLPDAVGVQPHSCSQGCAENNTRAVDPRSPHSADFELRSELRSADFSPRLVGG